MPGASTLLFVIILAAMFCNPCKWLFSVTPQYSTRNSNNKNEILQFQQMGLNCLLLARRGSRYMLLSLKIPFLVGILLSVHTQVYHFCPYLLSYTPRSPNNKLVNCRYFSFELQNFFLELHVKKS